MCGLGSLLRERFVMKFSSRFWIEGQIELVFPTEFESGFADCIIPILRAGMAFGEVGGVRG